MAKKPAAEAPPKIQWPVDKVERWPIAKLLPYARNVLTHTDAEVAELAGVMREFGWTMPVLVDAAGSIIAGHGRVLAARLLEITQIPTMVARGWTARQVQAYRIIDNQMGRKAKWDAPMLRIEIDDLREQGLEFASLGFEPVDLEEIFGRSQAEARAAAGNLVDRFGVAPFSVLNAREGWWQGRKAAWIALGIQSELGRGDNLLKFSDTVNETQAGRNPNRKRRAA